MSKSPTDPSLDDSPAIVLHVPHASTEIPKSARPSIMLSDSELETEIQRMTDWYTDELFAYGRAPKTGFPISRLIVDPERFLDDDEEPMAVRGMGVIYTSTSESKPLRTPPTAVQRQEQACQTMTSGNQRVELRASE